MICNTGHYRRSLLTGAGTSLSFITMIFAFYHVIKRFDLRKLILLIGATTGFITCILNSYFYLVPGYQDPKFQLKLMFCFLFTLLAVSLASVKRYFIYSESKRIANELIAAAVITVAVMYSGAIYSNVLYKNSSKFGMLLLGIIPISHITLGIMLFIRQTRKKVSETSLVYTVASWSMYVNIVQSVIWFSWIVLFILQISAADLECFLVSLCLATESSVVVLFSRVQQSHKRDTSNVTENQAYQASEMFFKSPTPSRRTSWRDA